MKRDTELIQKTTHAHTTFIGILRRSLMQHSAVQMGDCASTVPPAGSHML